jgi:oligopeptide/dipeptide ABC transporter ATP-binding protein
MTDDAMAADVAPSRPAGALLSVRDLTVRFPTRRGPATVVAGVSFDVQPGRTLALVGESGSGKSVSTLAITGLLAGTSAQVSGSAVLDGTELVGADDRTLRGIRGNRIGMVFQDPMTALNPVLTVGRQITESMQVHLGLSRAEASKRAVELLGLVGIPDPARRLDDHPHRFSGGMRQRVMIAIGLACSPDLLVADEATTALDVTTQAQIVELVLRLQQELGMAVLWITHDLGVVARIAHRVAVMYAGRILEEADTDDLFARPLHPYTNGLLGALPVVGRPSDELATIPGLPPDPTALPIGCVFHPRCGRRLDARCATEAPPLREVTPGHLVRSFYEDPEPVRAGSALEAPGGAL